VKGATEIANGVLAPGQSILFLSFARATVARIAQESKVRVPREARSRIEISTYHGFAWEFIRGHGYLLTGHRWLRLLPPPDAAGKLAGIVGPDRPADCNACSPRKAYSVSTFSLVLLPICWKRARVSAAFLRTVIQSSFSTNFRIRISLNGG